MSRLFSIQHKLGKVTFRCVFLDSVLVGENIGVLEEEGKNVIENFVAAAELPFVEVPNNELIKIK